MLGFYGEPVPAGGLEIVADLLALAVAEEFRGAGIGQALLDHVIEVATRISASTNAAWLRLTVEQHSPELGRTVSHLSSRTPLRRRLHHPGRAWPWV